MRRAAYLLVLSPVALLALSCKSDPAASNSPAPINDAGVVDSGATLSPEAQAFLASVCGDYAPCCDAAKPTSTCADATSAIGLAKSFDVIRAKACLDELAIEAKNKRPAIFCAHSPGIITCQAVFKGASLKPAGADCAANDECANGDLDVDGICVTKKCQQVKRGKVGDVCIGTRLDGATHLQFPTDAPSPGAAVCAIDDGLYCDETTKKCRTRGATGEDCTFVDGACVDGAYCADTKQCLATLTAGAECESSDQCGISASCVNDEESGKTICATSQNVDGACVRGDECDTRQALQCSSDTTKCVIDVGTYGNACLGSLALAPKQ